MAVITTSTWSDQVQTLYEADYIMALARQKVYGQFIKRRMALGAKRGSSVTWVIPENMTAAVTQLNQSNDVTPQTSADNTTSITVYEYGNALRITAMLEATAYTDVHKVAAETIANNFAESTEILTRYQFLQGTRVYRPSGVVRTSLSTSTSGHDLDYANLANVKAQCRGILMPDMANGLYAAVIPPGLEASLLADSNWLALAEYNNGNTKGGNIYTGEIGQLCGFRFTVSPWGKVYWGGATVANTTTISSAVAAGDTTVSLTSDSGIAVGDFLTIGTLEAANTETVQVTSGSSSPWTVMGVGSSEDNTGFKYAHDSGAACVEAQSAGAMVIVGDRSVGMVYSDKTGADGKQYVTEPSAAIPHRFTDFSWHLIAGWGILAERYIMRAEFPLPFGMLGYTEAIPA